MLVLPFHTVCGQSCESPGLACVLQTPNHQWKAYDPPKLFLFMSPLATSHTPPPTTEKLIKLEPWRRKVPHIWTRCVVNKWWYRGTRFSLCNMKQSSLAHPDQSFSKWASTRQGRWRCGGGSGQCWTNWSPCFHSMPEGEEWKSIPQSKNEQLVQKVLIYYGEGPAD